MKKTLLILGLATLFSCNRENENLGITEQSYSSSKTTSSRSGDIGAQNIDFLPYNSECEIGEAIFPIDNLPSAIINPNIKVNTKYDPLLTSPDTTSLPELIINYLNNRGIIVQQTLFNNNTPPAGSYFENNFYKEFTFTEGKPTAPDDNGNIVPFITFTFDNYMDNDKASIVVQNVYSKIVKNMPASAKGTIKAIRIFYKNDYICSSSQLQEERRNLKIQVIYKLNYATHTPMLEP
ncbi:MULTISPECIES: hypothetical protein [Chryseobacterium]|uniref:hypothetical protein n=1 Tax=Chryseobacterium TaxID=59732 RepID=UPI00210EAA38|nr:MULTISPECIES: hypothetical protein [Chryseobacterium]MCQ4138434.1 hypothetical protein [Chryseobacterium sp. EO14]WBV53163.1 hypothetical protein PFY09_02355 [Chryseobacterium gambrini]